MAKNKELQTTTATVSLTTLEPAKLARKLGQIRTVKDAIELAESDRDNCPSIARLRTQYGTEAIEDIIKLYLFDLTDNLNLKRPLKDAQVESIAYEVVTEYYSLTIADIHVIFRKAKTGEYGSYFESLDTPKVMTWFRDYFSDRCAAGANISIRTQFYDKGGNLTPQRMTKYFDAMQDKFNKSKK